jgi:glutamyl-tRNA reductase
VIKFEKWLNTLAVVPTIVSLEEKGETIRLAEIRKSLAGLGPLSSEQRRGLETLALSIVEKILNDSIVFLKQKSERPQATTSLHVARKLFSLDHENDPEEEHGHPRNDTQS